MDRAVDPASCDGGGDRVVVFPPAPVETVNGYLGGEKIGLFEDRNLSV